MARSAIGTASGIPTPSVTTDVRIDIGNTMSSPKCSGSKKIRQPPGPAAITELKGRKQRGPERRRTTSSWHRRPRAHHQFASNSLADDVIRERPQVFGGRQSSGCQRHARMVAQGDGSSVFRPSRSLSSGGRAIPLPSGSRSFSAKSQAQAGASRRKRAQAGASGRRPRQFGSRGSAC